MGKWEQIYFPDYQTILVVREICFILLFFFFACPKKKNEKEKAPSHLSRRWRDAQRSSRLPGLCKLGFASNSANPLFGSLSGARLRDNGRCVGQVPGEATSAVMFSDNTFIGSG